MSCCCCCFDAFFFLFLLSFLTSFMASTQKSQNLTCFYHDCPNNTATFDSATTSIPPSQASSPPGPGRGVNYTAIIVAISVPLGVVSLLYIIGFVAMRKKKGSDTTSVIDGDDIVTEDSLQIDFRTIQAATHDFSGSNKLGEGGFGEVYKVMFFSLKVRFR